MFSKIVVIICTFFGALFLMLNFFPKATNQIAASFAGYSVTWPMLIAVVAVMFAWKMKAR